MRSLIATAICLVLLCPALLASGASASADTSSGRDAAPLLFAGWNQQATGSSGPVIFSVNPDGSNLRQIGPGAWPELSPNGREVTYQVPARPWDIAVMRSDGTQARILAHNGLSPHWSADGTKIVFTRITRVSGAMYVVSARGGPARLLLRGGTGPAWSPDGTKILYRGPDGLYTMRPDGRDRTLVHHGSYSFTEWSPDGSQIAALVGSYVYVMNADGSGLHRLPRKIEFKNIDCSLAWSPDGRTIAFTPQRNGGVYVASARGGKGTPIPGTKGACGVSWAH